MQKTRFFHETIPELNKLKKIFSGISYKNMDLWPSMAPSSYYYQHYKSMGHKGFQLLRMLKFLFFKEEFGVKGQGKNKILASFLIDRKDHHKLFTKYLSKFDKNELLMIDAFQEGQRDYKSIKNRFVFGFPNPFKLFKIWSYLRKKRLNKIIKTKIDYFYFILMTYYQYKKIDYWDNLFNKYQPRAYVCYSSYRNNDETIMTQICNKNNKTTFTFQNYNISEFKEFNYESITYENFISDYFLLWGKSNYEVLKKFIDHKKLLLAGNPNYGRADEIKRTRFNPKKCTFFLSHPSYKQSNFKILDIMSKFSKEHPEIKFYMNLHPDNNEEEYKKKIESDNIKFLSNDNITKEELLENNDLIILYNSTLVLEALSLQIPLFRYKDESFIKMPIPNNNFSSLKELRTLFNKMLKPNEYKKSMKLNFKCYNDNFFYPKTGSVAENYKKLISENVKPIHET